MTQIDMHNHMESTLYYLFIRDHNILIKVEGFMHSHMIQILMASLRDVLVFDHLNQYVYLIKISLILVLILQF